MSRFVTVSLEGNEVKIIHSSIKLGNIYIDKMETVADREFDDYLERENAEEYVVVYDFGEYFHDVILIPALKPKYIKKVVESEIRKATGKTDFTFVYSILGDRVVDNKKMIELFYYMVTDEAIRNVVERFYDHGKIVKALYPDVFTAAVLVDRKASKQIKMGVIIEGLRRIVFTTKNGIINYVRDYTSLEPTVSDFDVKNINMTLTYCKQNLRMDPLSVTFVGDLTGFSEVKTKPDVPVVQPEMPDNIKCEGEMSCGYALPCASLNASRAVSILSKKFKNIYVLRRLLEGASLTFVLLSVICLGLIFYIVDDVFQTRHDIRSAVSEFSGVQKEYGEYLDRQETMNDIMPFVDFLNRPSIDIGTLLVEMSGIKLQNLRLNEVNAEAEGDASFLVSISGMGLINTYSSFQASFDKLVDRLEKMNNVKLKNKVINHMDKTFLVQLYYGK